MQSVDQKYYQTTYSDDDVIQICELSNIDASQYLFLKTELEHFAAIWRANKDRFSGPEQTPYQISTTLKKVEKLADKLSDLIETLPNDALRSLRSADDKITTESLFVDGRDRSTAGHKITRFTSQDGEETLLIDDWDDLVWSVEAIAAVAEKATSIQRSPIKGPRYSMANGVWISNVATLWENNFGREFTRDVLSTGEPISDASIFCVAAFKVIDPNLPSSTILNLMKKHIRNKRRKTTGKVGSKN